MIYNKTIISNDDSNNTLLPSRGRLIIVYIFVIVMILIFFGTVTTKLTQFQNFSGIRYAIFGFMFIFIIISVILPFVFFYNINRIASKLVFEYEFEEELFRCTTTLKGIQQTETYYYSNLMNIVYIDDIYYFHVNAIRKYHVKESGFSDSDLEKFKKLIENVRR